MLSLFSSTQTLVITPLPAVAAPIVQVAQKRAMAISEPALPTPFLIAKEGIPKVSYDYTRGLDELNGIDVWADIPTTSEVNRAKGTDKVYRKTVKALTAPVEDKELPVGYKSIREEIEEDRAKMASRTSGTGTAKKAYKDCPYCLNR